MTVKSKDIAPRFAAYQDGTFSAVPRLFSTRKILMLQLGKL